MRSLKKSASFYLAVAGLATLINVTAFVSKASQEAPTAPETASTSTPVPSAPVVVPDQPTLVVKDIARTGEIYRLRVTGEGWTKERALEVFFFDDRIREKLTLSGTDACDMSCRSDQIDLTVQVPISVIPGAHRLVVAEEGTDARAEVPVTIPFPSAVTTSRTPKISIVSPPVATADVSSLTVRGEQWGPYDIRRDARAWLFPPDKPENAVELRVSRNYNEDELFLTIEFTDAARELPPRDYLLYVITGAGQEATAPFYLLQKTDLSSVAKPTIVLTPNKGPIGVYVMVSGGGFPARSGAIVRLDGVALSGNVVADDQGTFDNVGAVIPRTLEKNGKLIVLTQGLHTVEVDAGDGKRAQATFDIMEEDGTALTKAEKEKIVKEERAKKEQAEKDAREKKKVEQDVKKKTDELSALRKKSGKKKSVADLQKKLDALRAKQTRLEMQLGKELYAGKPCSADRAITFQPGCIPPNTQIVPTTPYAGKPCDPLLPKVWQEGCVSPAIAEPSVQYYVKDSAGKACKTDIAITFQPGCIPPPPAPAQQESDNPKKCDPMVPAYMQKGCVQ